MQIKVIKTNDEGKKEVLDINFDADERAIIGDHSVDESEKIIKEFIEGKPAENKSAEDEVEAEKKESETIKIEGPMEVVYGKDNWHGEKLFVGPYGTLRLTDDIDPEIDIKGGLVIYDQYSVGLTPRQKVNVQNATEDSQIAFSDCYFNEDLSFGQKEISIDKGIFDRIEFVTNDKTTLMDRKYELHIVDESIIDYVKVGISGYLDVNCKAADEDDKVVEINAVVIEGTADLCKCNIGNVVVANTGFVDIYGHVEHMCVSGTAHITSSAETGSIHLHPGGRIYGELDDIDITSDRPFRMYKKNDVVWFVG
jgi:hypothetical protein